MKRNITNNDLKVPEKPKLKYLGFTYSAVEQSCLTYYHFKRGRPKTQIHSKLCQKIGYEKTSLHISQFCLMLSFNKSVKILWIKINIIQLNEKQTAPYFFLLSQNITSDCLLISVFTPVFHWIYQKVSSSAIQSNLRFSSGKFRENTEINKQSHVKFWFNRKNMRLSQIY